jgi:hypothetical protein
VPNSLILSFFQTGIRVRCPVAVVTFGTCQAVFGWGNIENVKARVKLALQQADMRARLKRHPRRRRRRIAKATNLQRRVVATIFAYERGWAPARIADFFGWPPEDVARWFEAGKPLL